MKTAAFGEVADAALHQNVAGAGGDRVCCDDQAIGIGRSGCGLDILPPAAHQFVGIPRKDLRFDLDEQPQGTAGDCRLQLGVKAIMSFGMLYRLNARRKTCFEHHP